VGVEEAPGPPMSGSASVCDGGPLRWRTAPSLSPLTFNRLIFIHDNSNLGLQLSDCLGVRQTVFNEDSQQELV